MAMSRLQTSSCNYKGIGQKRLNSPLTFENHCKSHTPFFNFYCLTAAIDFYPCLWHYSELPTLSPATIPVAAALPPGHTWGNAVVCGLWWDGSCASRVTWPICHFALLPTIIFGLHICCPLCHWVSGCGVIFPPRVPPCWFLPKQILFQWHLGDISSAYPFCSVFPSPWAVSIPSPLWHHICFQKPKKTG